MILSLDASVRIPEHVLFRELLDGEAVVLDIVSGIYFGLDDVGTRVWQLLEEYQVLRRVLGVLGSEYDVALPHLEADLLRFVDQLRAKGLVSLQ